MINDSVRAKTKHSASYLQSTCSCGPIGREWKKVQAAHGLIMETRERERNRMERRKKRGREDVWVGVGVEVAGGVGV